MPRLFLVLAAIGALFAFFSYSVDMDDFFITMRYAANLAGGKGFVFNSGERVLGTTTPLFALLVALFMKTGMSAILAVRLICSLALFGTAFFCYAYFRQKNQELLGFAAGLLFFFLFPLAQLWGNEIPLCFLFIFAALYFFEQEKWTTSALFQCLYALTRMEGVAFFVLFSAILFWKEKKIIYGVLIPPLFTIVPWLVFSYAYFGDIFPNTLYAKARQGTRPDIWASYGYGFFKTLKRLFVNGRLPVLSLLAWLGLIRILRRRHALLLVWCGLHQAAYWLLGVPGSYEWYYYTLWILYPVTMAGGIDFFSGARAKFSELNRRSVIIYLALLAFVLFIGYRQPHANTFFRSRHELYNKVTRYVRENFPPQTNIIADEIGIIGYDLPEFTILDTAGLIHREFPPDAYFKYDYLVKTHSPRLIINCLYVSKGENAEILQHPLIIPTDSGKKVQYNVIKIFPGERLVVRILKRG